MTSDALINNLRLMFTTFGIPNELAMDGGPQNVRSAEHINAHTRALRPLAVRDHVLVQNQAGRRPGEDRMCS